MDDTNSGASPPDEDAAVVMLDAVSFAALPEYTLTGEKFPCWWIIRKTKSRLSTN